MPTEDMAQAGNNNNRLLPLSDRLFDADQKILEDVEVPTLYPTADDLPIMNCGVSRLCRWVDIGHLDIVSPAVSGDRSVDAA
ncbi:unnamed protein product [Lampetra fluviatilis]